MPVERCRGLDGDPSDSQARYLEAEVDGLTIASVYLPNGNPQPGPKFAYKLAWFDRLIRHAQGLMDEAGDVVLAGDFNVVPTNADIYNAWLWRFDAVLQPESRASFEHLLDQGWIDTTRHLHPTERIYTFWVNEAAFRRNAGFRMDFLLLKPDLAPRLVGAEVDSALRGRAKPSDHAPVWVELRARAGSELKNLRAINRPQSTIPANMASVAAAMAAVASQPSHFQRRGSANSPIRRRLDAARMTATMMGTEMTALITADQ